MIGSVKLLEEDYYDTAKLQVCTEEYVIKLSPSDVKALKNVLVEMEPKLLEAHKRFLERQRQGIETKIKKLQKELEALKGEQNG